MASLGTKTLKNHKPQQNGADEISAANEALFRKMNSDERGLRPGRNAKYTN
jgi:hypothetical protein